MTIRTAGCLFFSVHIRVGNNLQILLSSYREGVNMILLTLVGFLVIREALLIMEEMY